MILPVTLETPEIHAVYLERWRAEHVLHHLHRLSHGRAQWSSVHSRPVGSGERGGSGGASGPRLTSAVAYIDVRPEASLAYDGERLKLYRGDFRNVAEALPAEQRDALMDALARRRYSAAFHLVRSMSAVRRNPDASPALERAALALGQAAKRQEAP